MSKDGIQLLISQTIPRSRTEQSLALLEVPASIRRTIRGKLSSILDQAGQCEGLAKR